MQFVEEGGRPTIPEDMPREYQSLVERCWSRNPDERPPFGELVESLHSMTILVSNQDEDADVRGSAGEDSLRRPKSAGWLSRNLKSFTPSRKSQAGDGMQVPLIQIQ